MHNPWRFIRYFRYPIVAVVVSGIIFFQYPESWQVAGLLILFNAGTIAYQIFLSRRNINRRFRNSRLWQDSVAVTIDGKSIGFSGQAFDVASEWSEFSDIFESKRVFMLSKAGNKILFIPKSGMSVSQLVELSNPYFHICAGQSEIDGPRDVVHARLIT